MQIVKAGVYVVAMCAITIFIWYVTQPIVYSLLNTMLNLLHQFGVYRGDVTMNLLKFLSNIWVVIMCIVYILWGLIVGTKNDTETYYAF